MGVRGVERITMRHLYFAFSFRAYAIIDNKRSILLYLFEETSFRAYSREITFIVLYYRLAWQKRYEKCRIMEITKHKIT